MGGGGAKENASWVPSTRNLQAPFLGVVVCGFPFQIADMAPYTALDLLFEAMAPAGAPPLPPWAEKGVQVCKTAAQPAKKGFAKRKKRLLDKVAIAGQPTAP